jgi:hypothetical protein
MLTMLAAIVLALAIACVVFVPAAGWLVTHHIGGSPERYGRRASRQHGTWRAAGC